MRKLLVFISIFLGCISINIYGEKFIYTPNSKIEYALWDLKLYEHFLTSVNIDMQLYTDYLFDYKRELKRQARQAIKRLGILEKEIEKKEFPSQLFSLNKKLVDLIKMLKSIYENIDDKSKSEIHKKLEAFQKEFSKYSSKLDEFRCKDGFSFENLPVLKIPQPHFEEEGIAKKYQEALKYIQDKKYIHAYNILSTLIKKIDKKSPNKDFIFLFISDTLIRASYSITSGGIEMEEEKGLDKMSFFERYNKSLYYLERIMRKDYSPLFIYAFFEWRLLKQAFEYGESSWSQMPNWIYNIERKKLIDKIKSYLNLYPQDKWARYQAYSLLMLPEISAKKDYGNTNIEYSNTFYID